MKKTIKCGIVAAVAVAAGFAAYQSYGSYGLQDNSLLMQNIEALASNQEPDDDRDYDGDESISFIPYECYMNKANEGDLKYICPPGTKDPNFKECKVQKKVNNLFDKSYCLKVVND